MLLELELHGFRCFSDLRIECGPALNCFTGSNACGKTSLLEAIYFLSRARSFRCRLPQDLIRRGAAAFRLVARIESDGRRETLGMQRDAQSLVVRHAGTTLASLAELSRLLPVLLLTPDSHRLLDDGPKSRRRFIDWGVFQRDALFLGHWRRFTQALRQRNAALRDPRMSRGIEVWEREIAQAAVSLDAARSVFCAELDAELSWQAQALLGLDGVRLEYRRGWHRDHELEALLAGSRDGDRRLGHTRLGPQRADFQVRIQGRPPGAALSRGQHKLLVAALMLAQAALYRRHHEQCCTLLVDDLAAELDQEHRARFITALSAAGAQVFLTVIEPAAIAGLLPADSVQQALPNAATGDVL